MSKVYLFGNWKMNMDRASIDSFFTNLADVSIDIDEEVLAIFLPSVYLERSRQKLSDLGLSNKVALGLQNINPEEKGAFTGEISLSMASDCGAEYVIVGHSERRHIFKETDDFIAKKVYASQSKGMKTVLCVGELLSHRDEGKAWMVVENQLESALSGLDKLDNLIVAYEPVWAIGTGRTASSEDAQDMCHRIKTWLKDHFKESIPILYGGSVKPENIGELLSMEDIDGGLIGGASLKASSYIDMIKKAKM